MTRFQQAIPCLCRRSNATPAYQPPDRQNPARRWHTPDQCGVFESGHAPTVALTRGIVEPPDAWQARVMAAYPIV
jgi:hypothetical protein